MTERVLVLAAAQQKRLGDATRVLLVPHEPRGHHARLVGDEQIAGLEIVDDISEVAVIEAAIATMQHEQPTGVARLCRGLGDELIG